MCQTDFREKTSYMLKYAEETAWFNCIANCSAPTRGHLPYICMPHPGSAIVI